MSKFRPFKPIEPAAMLIENSSHKFRQNEKKDGEEDLSGGKETKDNRDI